MLRILQTYSPELRELCGVRALGIFGLYIRGEQARGSDVDLLVDSDRLPMLPEFIDFEYHLSKLLGVKVDSVTRRVLASARESPATLLPHSEIQSVHWRCPC